MLTLSPLLREGKRLRGSIQVPGDKSISHRAVMFGALAQGTTRIDGFLSGADCLSTVNCFRRLGIRIGIGPEPGQVLVEGKGLRGLAPADPAEEVRLYTGNSGTTTRILAGILAPQSFVSVLYGDPSVNSRPMQRVIEPLSQMGARIESLDGSGCAPLRIRGSGLHGTTYLSPLSSAQVKSAVLCAGLYADSPVTFIEPFLSRDHTERMLRAFGARIDRFSLRKRDPVSGPDAPSGEKDAGLHREATPGSDARGARIHPCGELFAQRILIPGDLSSAAYLSAAASLVPGSEILLRNVGFNPTRTGMLEAAQRMGADISVLRISDSPEPAADLLVRAAPLHGAVLSGPMIPRLIDELPVLAVMAAAAEGTTVIRDAAELRVKETDRIAAVTQNLRAMGVQITATDDGMVIEGGNPLQGAPVHTFGDHRIAMSFAVAALIADGPVFLDDERCVRISYPGFFEDLASLVVNGN